MVKLTTQEYWDSEWKDLLRPSKFDPNICYQFAFDSVFRELLPKGALKALEIGVGASIWTSYFEKYFGYEVFGIDFSWEGCISASKNHSIVMGRELNVLQGDIFACPLQREFFDIVYSLGVIEHFYDPSEVLFIAKDLLKPGGILLTTIPNKTGIAGLMERWLNSENYYHHTPLTKEDITAIYRMAGLSQIKADYFGQISLMGKSPKQMGTVLKIITRINRLIAFHLFSPFYMWGRVHIKQRALSSYIYAIGIR